MFENWHWILKFIIVGIIFGILWIILVPSEISKKSLFQIVVLMLFLFTASTISDWVMFLPLVMISTFFGLTVLVYSNI